MKGGGTETSTRLLTGLERHGGRGKKDEDRTVIFRRI